jgi:hypothetical protein
MLGKVSRAAVLTDDVVRRLRQLDRAGRVNVREAAVMYGVGAETIRRALRGETWQHVKDAPPPLREDEIAARIAASQAGLLARLAAEGVSVTVEATTPDLLGDAAKARETAAAQTLAELLGVGKPEDRYG